MSHQTSEPLTASPQETSHPARVAPLGRTIALLGATFGLSVVLTGSISRSKQDRFPGRLLADKDAILATTDGTLSEIMVKSGEVVSENQPLVVLAKPKMQVQLDGIDQQIQRLEAELCSAQAKAGVESQRLVEELDQQIFKLEDQIAVLGGDCFIERVRAKAWSEQSNYITALTSTEVPITGIQPLTKDFKNPRTEIQSILQEAEAENRAETLKARIELCQNRLTIIRSRKDQVVKQYESAVGVPQIEKQLAQVRQQRDDLSQKSEPETMQSRRYGITGSIARQPNEEVKAGDVLLEVFDRDHEFLEAHVPARLASVLKPGAIVLVHFPDDVTREGQIEAIPPETSRTSKNESDITIRVLPTGKVWPYLPVGSTVDVSIR